MPQLPERYGRTTLIVLARSPRSASALRADAVVNPSPTPATTRSPTTPSPSPSTRKAATAGPTSTTPATGPRGAAALRRRLLRHRRAPRRRRPDPPGAARGRDDHRRLPARPPARRRPERAACIAAPRRSPLYPPFIHSTGEVMSEPPAMFTLPAAVLAFLWAADRRRHAGPGLVPGLLFGATAMFRPEYLARRRAFVLAAARPGAALAPAGRARRHRGAGDAGRPLLPSRSSPGRPQLRRARPPDADLHRRRQGALRRHLPPGRRRIPAGQGDPLERYTGRACEPDSEALDEVDPTPLFNRVAERYPDLPRDAALGKIGKENLSEYLGDDPLGYAGMTVRKVGRMWSSGVGEAMAAAPARVIQMLLVAARARRPGRCSRCAPPLVGVVALGAPIVLGHRGRRARPSPHRAATRS